MSIIYSLLLLFACLEVVQSGVREHPELSLHKDFGRKNDGVQVKLTVEEMEHIGKFYIELFNKLIKADNSTELGLYLTEFFHFHPCEQTESLGRREFLKYVHNERKNLLFKFERSEFEGPGNITVLCTINSSGHNYPFTIWISELADGSWEWLSGWCSEPPSAPRRFVTAPNGTLARNSTDGSERIGKFYTALFDELVKENDFTNLALNIHDRFSFRSCTKRWYDKGEFLELIHYEQKNVSMKFEHSTFESSREINVFVTMNILGDQIVARFVLQESRDTVWQWLMGRCLVQKSYSAPRLSFTAPDVELAQNGTNGSQDIAIPHIKFFEANDKVKDEWIGGDVDRDPE